MRNALGIGGQLRRAVVLRAVHHVHVGSFDVVDVGLRIGQFRFGVGKLRVGLGLVRIVLGHARHIRRLARVILGKAALVFGQAAFVLLLALVELHPSLVELGARSVEFRLAFLQLCRSRLDGRNALVQLEELPL